MDTEKNHSVLTEFIRVFLEALTIENEVAVIEVGENRSLIKITIASEQGYVIGKHGETLLALQHIVSLLARKAGSNIQYRIDINDYQEEKNKIFLKRVADYVEEKKESVELLLWPMSGYERRLVHEYFLSTGTHSTESEDFGSKRVIRVIKK